MSCKCQHCGRQYRIDIGVPDEVWDRIKPEGKPSGGGMLCGACIMARLEALGVYGSYELEESGSYIPQQRQPKTGPAAEPVCALSCSSSGKPARSKRKSLAELDGDYS